MNQKMLLDLSLAYLQNPSVSFTFYESYLSCNKIFWVRHRSDPTIILATGHVG